MILFPPHCSVRAYKGNEMDKEVDSQLLRAFELCKKDNDLPSDYALAAHLGINRPSLSRWKSGKTNIIRHNQWKEIEPILKKYIDQAFSDEVADSFARPFEYKVTIGVTDPKIKSKLSRIYNEFSKGISELAGMTQDSINEAEKQIIDFPYLTHKVSAGNGLIPDMVKYDDRPDMDILTVQGESMEPTYKEGEKIIVHVFQEPVRFGEHFLPIEIIKTLIPEGTVIVYDRNESGIAMKRVKYGTGKSTWHFKLTADNEEWAKVEKFNRVIRKGDDFVIYGKVLGKLK